jgi:hypothetical protein
MRPHPYTRASQRRKMRERHWEVVMEVMCGRRMLLLLHGGWKVTVDKERGVVVLQSLNANHYWK